MKGKFIFGIVLVTIFMIVLNTIFIAKFLELLKII